MSNKNLIENKLDVCKMCEGEGYVYFDSEVYPGEGIYADLGAKSPCPVCKARDDDYEPQ